MSYRTRSARRTAQKGKQRFLITVILIILLLWGVLTFILPSFIEGIGFISSFLKPSTQKQTTSLTENATLAPPVLYIPYEATNTATIHISGYAATHSKVKIYVDDELKDTVEVSAEGNFTLKKIDLSLGTNNIYGKTIDEKEQESLPSKTIKLIFDNEKPKLDLSEPEDGKAVKGDKKVKIAGTTESDVQVFVNDTQVVINSEGKFDTIMSLNDGDNNFTVKAKDRASNTTEITRKVTFQP